MGACTTTFLFLLLRLSGPRTDECPPGARREMIRTMAHDTVHGLSTIETSIDHRLTTGNPVRVGVIVLVAVTSSPHSAASSSAEATWRFARLPDMINLSDAARSNSPPIIIMCWLHDTTSLPADNCVLPRERTSHGVMLRTGVYGPHQAAHAAILVRPGYRRRRRRVPGSSCPVCPSVPAAVRASARLLLTAAQEQPRSAARRDLSGLRASRYHACGRWPQSDKARCPVR